MITKQETRVIQVRRQIDLRGLNLTRTLSYYINNKLIIKPKRSSLKKGNKEDFGPNNFFYITYSLKSYATKFFIPKFLRHPLVGGSSTVFVRIRYEYLLCMNFVAQDI